MAQPLQDSCSARAAGDLGNYLLCKERGACVWHPKVCTLLEVLQDMPSAALPLASLLTSYLQHHMYPTTSMALQAAMQACKTSALYSTLSLFSVSVFHVRFGSCCCKPHAAGVVQGLPAARCRKPGCCIQRQKFYASCKGLQQQRSTDLAECRAYAAGGSSGLPQRRAAAGLAAAGRAAPAAAPLLHRLVPARAPGRGTLRCLAVFFACAASDLAV